MPNWDQAPEWAQYCAQDPDGRWTWYEKEPMMGSVSWYTGGKEVWADNVYSTWKDSLQRRGK